MALKGNLCQSVNGSKCKTLKMTIEGIGLINRNQMNLNFIKSGVTLHLSNNYFANFIFTTTDRRGRINY